MCTSVLIRQPLWHTNETKKIIIIIIICHSTSFQTKHNILDSEDSPYYEIRGITFFFFFFKRNDKPLLLVYSVRVTKHPTLFSDLFYDASC